MTLLISRPSALPTELLRYIYSIRVACWEESCNVKARQGITVHMHVHVYRVAVIVVLSGALGISGETGSSTGTRPH